MTALESWTTEDVIGWIKSNLSTQYHACIEVVKEHDIDGKLLNECLNDKDAKSSLLQILFPNTSDAFLRLSFMRKIEKFHESFTKNDENNDVILKDKDINDQVEDQDVDMNESVDINEPSQQHNNNNSKLCHNCGTTISSFLFENHQRHCIKQQTQNDENNQEQEEEEEEEQKQIEIKNDDLDERMIAQIEENIDVECQFCEIGFNISLIEEHSIYCGSRTEQCHKCGLRDTLARFKNNQHNCYEIKNRQNQNNNNNNNNNSNNGNININDINNIESIIVADNDNNNSNITFNNSALDINNESNQLWISSFERHLYDLEKILHDRFVVDYNDLSSHFQQYDSFGNNKQKMYRQKANQNISKIRTYNMSSGNVSNESRHKFEKIDIYKGKSKDELRKEYDEKFKSILNLLQKILENIINEPLNKKYRILKCNNKKLKSLIFSYSSCCEFLKLCDFVYISDEICYKLIDANNAKLKIGIGVLKYVRESFKQKATKQDYEQNKWELNQAYIKNDKSIFHGSWSCKKCNHLNRKTSICKKCKTKKKHSPIKEKKAKMEIPLSVERWICGICGNRNAIQLKQCDNCKKDKVVATNQYQQYHQSKAKYQVSKKQQSKFKQDNDDDDDDNMYLHHDDWM